MSLLIIVLSCFLSYLSTNGLHNISLYNTEYFTGLSFISILIFFSFTFVIKKAIMVTTFKKFIYVSVLSFIYAFFLILGNIINQNDFVSCSMENIIAVILKSICLSPIIAAFISILFNFFDSLSKNLLTEKKSVFADKFFSKKRYIFLFILICWIPVYLSCFPGIWNYDTEVELSQFYLNRYTTHHSFLYSFLLFAFTEIGKLLGGFETGIAIYTFVQMVFFASCFSYCCNFLYKIKINKNFLFIILAFYTFSPINVVYSMSSLHDTWFAGLFLLFLIYIAEMFLMPESFNSQKFLQWIFIASLAALFRNTFLIILLMGLPFIFLITKNIKIRTNLIIMSICSLLICSAYSFMYKNIYKPVSLTLTETVSLPLHNVASVIINHFDEIDDSDKSLFFDIVPEAAMQHFSKYTVDPLKQDYNNRSICIFNENNLKRNFSEYKKMYFKFAKLYPEDYLNSFISLTIPYWMPDRNLSWDYFNCGLNCSFIEKCYMVFSSFDQENNNDVGAKTSNACDLYIGRKTNFLPGLHKFLDSIGIGKIMERVPVIYFLFSIAFNVWCVLFLCFYNFYKSNELAYIQLMYVSLVLICFLFGPMALLRYMLPIYVSLPLLFILSIYNTSNDK